MLFLEIDDSVLQDICFCTSCYDAVHKRDICEHTLQLNQHLNETIIIDEIYVKEFMNNTEFSQYCNSDQCVLLYQDIEYDCNWLFFVFCSCIIFLDVFPPHKSLRKCSNDLLIRENSARWIPFRRGTICS